MPIDEPEVMQAKVHRFFGRNPHAAHAACGSGPVVFEGAGSVSVRVICCYCWAHTTPHRTEHAALLAWQEGRVRSWINRSKAA